MLTKIIGTRVYDFSHVIGDPNETLEPVALAVGAENELFAIIKGILEISPSVTRFSLGDEPGDERIVNVIGGGYGVEPGQFVWPSGIALDSDRNIYVTDAWTDRISVFSESGDFLRSFGSPGDGSGQFRRPSGIAIDEDDNLLVVDTLNHRVQRLSRDGCYLSEWGGMGSEPGQFDSPWGITTDADGCIYVADHLNHRIQKFDAEGGFIFELGSQGSGDHEFDHPSDVAVDPDGDIYVCDWVNNRVGCFDSEGAPVTTFAGDAQELSKWQRQYVAGNPDVYKARRRVYTLEPEWRFALPMAVVFDEEKSRLMVVDSQRHRIQIYNKLPDYRDPQFNI
jgi:DNA-binding beta-propeller fold protein YncE